MGFWDKLKSTAKKAVSTVQDIFSPNQQAAATSPTPTPVSTAAPPDPRNQFAQTFQDTKSGAVSNQTNPSAPAAPSFQAKVTGTDPARQTPTGNPVNTYDTNKGVYTDPTGQGFSRVTPPPTAQVIQVDDEQGTYSYVKPGDPPGVSHVVTPTGEDLLQQSGAAAPITGTDLGLAGAGIYAGITLGAAAIETAVSSSLTIGSVGYELTTTGAVASTWAANTATATATTSMLTSLGLPAVSAGTLLTVIGTYPFSGFIREEALQTLSFSYTTALNNDDFEGAQAALDEMQAILNPSFIDALLTKIPFVNVVTDLKNFFDAARVQYSINAQALADRKQQLESGEDDSAFYARINKQNDDREKALIDYYNDERKKLILWEEDAADRDMKEDAAFWRKEREKQRVKEAEDRQAIADFWFQYKKRLQEISDNTRPSQLNFGLL